MHCTACTARHATACTACTAQTSCSDKAFPDCSRGQGQRGAHASSSSWEWPRGRPQPTGCSRSAQAAGSQAPASASSPDRHRPQNPPVGPRPRPCQDGPRHSQPLGFRSSEVGRGSEVAHGMGGARTGGHWRRGDHRMVADQRRRAPILRTRTDTDGSRLGYSAASRGEVRGEMHLCGRPLAPGTTEDADEAATALPEGGLGMPARAWEEAGAS